MVECAGCGDPAELTIDAVNRRRTRGMGPWRCRYCTPRRRREPAEPDDGSWLRPDERESPRKWARRVAGTLRPVELAAVASWGSVLEAQDASSFARAPRRRERDEFEPAPHAKLEKPFGARLRR